MMIYFLWVLIATNIFMIYLYMRERLLHSIARTGLSRMLDKYKKDFSYEEFAEICIPNWVSNSTRKKILKHCSEREEE